MAGVDNGQGALRARDARREERAERERQTAVRKIASTILNPDEVAGDYDTKRLLLTTLGGEVRALTHEDLIQFRHMSRQLGKRFKGGITAKQVIDLSWKDDRERANLEIRNALPVSLDRGVIHFQTNAGPNSKKTRHHVYVQFLNWDAAVSSAIKPDKAAGEVTKGKIRFDCGCERHRFFFRYVATAGNYNYKLAETGYPKIRNPQLTGVACKHALRVMSLIAQSPTINHFIANAIARARVKANLDMKREDVKVKEVKDLAEKLKSESYRQRRVATTEEKRAERARWAKSKPVADLKAQAAAKAKAKAAKTAAKAVQNNIQKLLALGAISQAQADAMLSALK